MKKTIKALIEARAGQPIPRRKGLYEQNTDRRRHPWLYMTRGY
jgi:hypothetical protein